MNKLEDILQPTDVLDLFQGIDIGLKKGKDLTKVKYTNETYNPFDVNFSGNMILNNGLIVDFDKESKGYSVRIGYDDNWIGGLSFQNVRLIFNIKELTFECFKAGVLQANENIKYSLVSTFSSGHVDEIYKVGSIDELTAEAERLGYTRIDEYQREFPFYRGSIKGKLPLLSIMVLRNKND